MYLTDKTEPETPKLQHFRQILFWPLRLIGPSNQKGKTTWEEEGCAAYIQQQFHQE